MALDLTIDASTMNPLLHRRELVCRIAHPHQSTPSRNELSSELSSVFSAPTSLITIAKLITPFGANESTATAHIYSSAAEMEAVERPFVIARMKGVSLEKRKRRVRKEERKKAYKVFGTMKRLMKKAARRTKDD